MSAWLAALLQTADSSFPTGAYAHSGGLETLAALGAVRDAVTLSAFLRTRVVPMLGDYELPYLRFAREAAGAGDLATLLALDREFGAGKLPREAREASTQIGTRRLQTLARVWPEFPAQSGVTAGEFAAAIAHGEADGHAAIVCGWQAHWLDVPEEAAMTAYFYGSLSGYCSAALKLIRIGQEGCQKVLHDALTLAAPTGARARTPGGVTRRWKSPRRATNGRSRGCSSPELLRKDLSRRVVIKIPYPVGVVVLRVGRVGIVVQRRVQAKVVEVREGERR